MVRGIKKIKKKISISLSRCRFTGYRSVVECTRTVSNRPITGQAASIGDRVWPSVSLYGRSFLSLARPPPFFFSSDREKEGVDGGRREIVELVERGRGTNEPIEKAPMQLT